MMLETLGPVGEMLIEAPAQEDVEQLHPSANGKNREVALESGPQQLELETIPQAADVLGAGMALLGVKSRIDISPTGKDEARDTVEMRGVSGLEALNQVNVWGDVIVRARGCERR